MTRESPDRIGTELGDAADSDQSPPAPPDRNPEPAPASGTRRRRRAATNQLVTIYWRDIPAQVTATHAGEKGSWLLEERFQVAIDRAATVAGLTDADDYVLQWRRVAQDCNADPQASAEAEARRLEADYPPERVKALVATGGLDTNTPTHPETSEDSP